MSTDTTIEQLQAEIAALRSELRTAHATVPETASVPDARGSRRQLLRLAGGLVTGGAVAAVAGTGQAAATDGLTINAGAATSTANFTQVSYTGASTTGHQFLFRGPSTSMTATTTFLPSVLGGVSNGVASAVLAYNEGAGVGLLAQSLNGVAVDVIGWNNTAATFRNNSAPAKPVLEIAHDAGGNHITFGGGTAPYGRAAASPVSALAAEHGNLWWSVAAGSPGTWRKLAGPETAGAFHAIPTARVYDSRKTMGVGTVVGVIATGQNRVVPVRDQRDPSTGAVTTANVVPDKATAVAYNLTIVGAIGNNGFLAVEPGSALTAGGSTINWSTGGLTLANGSTAKLDDVRQLKVFCGGTSTSTHFIVDIVGYYL